MPPVVGAADLLRAYLSGRSERTLEAYRADLEDLRASDIWDGPRPATREAMVGELLQHGHGAANARILAYRATMLERGLAVATVNRRLAAVRSLVKLARTLGRVPWALEVPGLRSELYRDTRGPGREGFRRLLAAAGVTARPHGLRHSAITAALDLTAGDVRAVQKFSRHCDVRTLMIYDDARIDTAGIVASRVAAL